MDNSEQLSNVCAHPDVYELVWHQFKNTLIHEVLIRLRTREPIDWHDITWNDDPFFRGNRTYYYDPLYNRFLLYGFPLPEFGGIPLRWGTGSRVRIFMDDLSLCPD